MRLLKCLPDGEVSLTDDLRDHELPPYTILSHTWGPNGQEVLYKDLLDGTGDNKPGYAKIKFCAEQTRKDGLAHCWVDTCCIDKTNHTELHEAINSMFRWYKNAARCYVYLSDVSSVADHPSNICIQSSRWFTRGWTLQELLAPTIVEFFNCDGRQLGDKLSLEQQIFNATAIDIQAVRGMVPLSNFDIEERFRWAETRQTTREEDWAYCLLGIFGVFMPLLYGEGKDNATRRLKNEITDALTRDNHETSFLIGTNNDASRLNREQLQIDLLRWIGVPQVSSGTVSTPFPGTGTWLIDSPEYKDWISGDENSILWCCGPPGVGKSVLASVALQSLDDMINVDSTLLVHYFCEFANRKVQKKEEIWKSILRQMISQARTMTLKILKDALSRLMESRSASANDLRKWLQITCTNEKRVIAIFDGLDELEHVRDVKAILEPFITTNCSILVTSRDIPEIRAVLKDVSYQLDVSATNDLSPYIVGQFEDSGSEDILEDYPDLEKEIIAKSSGIFLLAKILLNHLLSLSTVKEMRKALKEYSTQLEEAFEPSLKRINTQSASQRSLAHKVLGWLVCAERKLLMTELVHALAVEDGVDVIDQENLPSSKIILKACSGLVAANVNDGTVTIVHSTVYAWLRSHYGSDYHQCMAKTCLNYLTLGDLSHGSAPNAAAMVKRIERFPLLPYASMYWHKHLQQFHGESGLEDTIDTLLNDVKLRSTAFQASIYRADLKAVKVNLAVFDTLPTDHTSLHVASAWNLRLKISRILKHKANVDLNATDSQQWTPLHWACFSGSIDAIHLLAHEGASLEAKDSVGWTPMFWLALNGDISTLNLLLQHGANHLHRDIHGWTILRWAIAKQQAEVVNTLLHHHNSLISPPKAYLSLRNVRIADVLRSVEARSVELIDEFQGYAPVPIDRYEQSLDLYSVLTDKSFDINHLWKSGHFDPPVGNAWRLLAKTRPACRSIKLDIPYYHSTDIGGDWGVRLLHRAIQDDKMAAVELLVKIGTDVNAQIASRTALHAAVWRRNPKYAEVLIDHGSDMENINHDGVTPLQQAVVCGFEDTVKLLLKKGARVNAIYDRISRPGVETVDSLNDKDLFETKTYGKAAGKTSLMLACEIDPPKKDPELCYRIVETLIEHGAETDVQSADESGRMIIHFAARSRNPRIIAAVIRAGADSRALDRMGRTAIHYFIGRFSHDKRDADDINESLNILSQSCGKDFLSRSAEWCTDRRRLEQMDSHTPLSLAIKHRQWTDVVALHRMGAHFHTTLPLQNMLVAAIEAAQLEAVEILLENGASLGTDCSVYDVDFLRGPMTHTKIDAFTSILAKVASYGFDMVATCIDGRQTLLHRVITRCDDDLPAMLLMELGADPYYQDYVGCDSFLLACIYGKYDILRYLLREAKVKEHSTIPTEGHWTQYLDPLALADESSSCIQVCSALSQAGVIASIFTTEDLGRGAFARAIECDNLHFVRSFLEHSSAVLDFTSDISKSYLTSLFYKRNAPLVEILLNHGWNLNELNEAQQTLLHFAASVGYSQIVDLLIAKGANVNASDEYGWTPLHFAAINGHARAVQSLLSAKASARAATTHFSHEGFIYGPSGLNSGDPWTGTALHLAAMQGSRDIVHQLLSDENALAVDVNAKSDNYERIHDLDSGPPSPGAGPTALHIVLATGSRYYDRIGLSEDRLAIASMLVDHGAIVSGVANHLCWDDIVYFKKFPELWDKLRAGIEDEEEQEEAEKSMDGSNGRRKEE